MSTEEKKASDKILDRINQLETNMKTLIEAKQPPQTADLPVAAARENAPTQEKGHSTVKEMLECKDCGKEARETILTPLQGQRIVKCKGCGTHVGENEAKCPSCGSSEAE
jgi:rubrerythrin